MMRQAKTMAATAVFCLLASAVAYGESSPEAPGEAQVKLNQPIPGAKLTVERVSLTTPMEVLEAGRKRQVKEVLEFRVTSSQPIEARALDPVLYVGKTKVTDYRYEDDGRTVVFSLTDTKKAQDGAPTYVQFGDQVSTRTPLQKFSRKQAKEMTR
ncbi:MAG TPA: hypothetical protein VLA99_00480 [Nitrospiraceae bacterium]|nr:hypothetical protein [Nitrospiraceae bacterium]